MSALGVGFFFVVVVLFNFNSLSNLQQGVSESKKADSCPCTLTKFELGGNEISCEQLRTGGTRVHRQCEVRATLL